MEVPLKKLSAEELENPAAFRTVSTALVITEITVNCTQEDWTQHDFYMVS